MDLPLRARLLEEGAGRALRAQPQAVERKRTGRTRVEQAREAVRDAKRVRQRTRALEAERR
jgi:hypothetical protein